MGRRQKKKSISKKEQESKPKPKPVLTEELISKAELTSENIIRLKLTTRKGTRIESIPLRKLERLATNSKLAWKLENDWLLLYGFT